MGNHATEENKQFVLSIPSGECCRVTLSEGNLTHLMDLTTYIKMAKDV